MLDFCDNVLVRELLKDVDEEQRMLQSFIKTVETDG
jgi:hypothetical protein